MRKRFVFRLAAVEGLRREKEQRALRELAHAQRKFQEALQAKQRLLEETESALQRRENLAKTAQPVLAYQLETEFITGNKWRVLHADQAILRCRKVVEKALRALIVAKRELKAIETLREKAFTEYKVAVRRQERKDVEELYVARHRWNENDPEGSERSESA